MASQIKQIVDAAENIGIEAGVPTEAVLGAALEKLPKDTTNGAQDVGGIAGGRLKSFIERIERLNEEKAALGEDIKEVYAEAKGVGFDTKIIRKVISLRKIDSEKRREEAELLALYQSAIGMQLSLI